jgi:hypothetical protein
VCISKSLSELLTSGSKWGPSASVHCYRIGGALSKTQNHMSVAECELPFNIESVIALCEEDAEQPASRAEVAPNRPLLTANTDLLDGVSIFHAKLWGQCIFSTLPPQDTVNKRPTGHNTVFRVFFGQVKREVSPSQMCWLIHRVCGVVPIHVESRTSGCYYAYASNQMDSRAMRNMHKRVLFDSEGVWIARDAERSVVLNDYVVDTRDSFPPHLPKDTIVVEEPRPQKKRRNNATEKQTTQNSVNMVNHAQPNPPPQYGDGSAVSPFHTDVRMLPFQQMVMQPHAVIAPMQPMFLNPTPIWLPHHLPMK